MMVRRERARRREVGDRAGEKRRCAGEQRQVEQRRSHGGRT